MAKLQSFRDLRVWQQSMVLVEDVYRATEFFPKHQQFTLASHLQKTAISVPSNIAEGYARSHRKEYLQHLAIAYGSLAELDTQLEIAYRLNYIQQPLYTPMVEKMTSLSKQITSLHTSLSKPQTPKSLQQQVVSGHQHDRDNGIIRPAEDSFPKP
jgi:four helix bundle protein